jgi:hypothetical protein
MKKTLLRCAAAGGLVLPFWPAAALAQDAGRAPAAKPPVRTAPAYPECVPGSTAHQAFEGLVRAYREGDGAALRRAVDPRMASGDAVAETAMAERQWALERSFQVQDVTSQCSSKAAAFQFRWDKRTVRAQDRRTSVQSGAGQFLFVEAEEQPGSWRLIAVSGDSPFRAAALPPAPPPRAPAAPPPGNAPTQGGAGGVPPPPPTGALN